MATNIHLCLSCTNCFPWKKNSSRQLDDKGFHWRACRVILFLPFLNVCPTHFHLRLPISICIGTCPVLSHSCSFLILSVHLSFKFVLKHLLTNTWSLFMTPCVVFQVSQPYSSSDLTFELKSPIFVEIEILDAFHTLLRLAKAVLAFPILVLTSASVPPFPSFGIAWI